MSDPTTPLIKAADVVPALDSVIGVIEDLAKESEFTQTKIAQLEAELARKDKIILEKVAAAAVPVRPVFDPLQVTATLNRLQDMNILDGEQATKYANAISKDPHEVLGLLTKVSEAFLSAPMGEGSGIAKEADDKSANNADPDGWGDFAAGRRVRPKP